MSNRGLLFVLSAPAGTGKTTLVEKLQKELPKVKKSITYTTRAPRSGEKQDVDYHFVSEEEFQKKIDSGEMLEHTKLFSSHYGVSKRDVEEKREKGFHVFLVIDVRGASEIRKKEDAITIFLLPPSMEELAARLKKRKSENKESIENRLKRAEEEIAHSIEYDYIIINDKLAVALDALRSVVIAEEHKVRK